MEKLTTEMEKLTTETKPDLFKAGKTLAAVAVGDPSVTIIEVHKALGFLLAESCYDSMEGNKLHLENVHWVRQVYKTDKKIFRSFSEVTLYCHSSDRFVAQDMASKDYLPWPSAEPYVVIFISKEQYDKLYQQIQKEAIEQLLESVKSVTKAVPGFSFKGNTLTAPPRYARASTRQLDRHLIEV